MTDDKRVHLYWGQGAIRYPSTDWVTVMLWAILGILSGIMIGLCIAIIVSII